MHFELVSLIRIPFESYFDVILDEKFNDWIKVKLQQDERKIVRLEEIDGVLHRTIRSEKVLSGTAKKYFKASSFVVEEHQQFWRDSGRFTWEYVPNVGRSRFSASGNGWIEKDGDHVKRTIEGDVVFKIPLIGKRIEGKMIDWLEDNIDKLGDAIEEYHRDHFSKRS